MNKLFLYAVGAVVVLIAGFFLLNSYIYSEKQGDAVQENETPIIGENLEGEADPSRMTLDMTVWRWVKASYNDGRTVTPKEPGIFTLTFKNGLFSAKTDCNSMSGSYSAKDGLITFGPIAMTKMYCEGSQEQDFAKLIENSAGYHFTSRGELILDLKFDSGTVTFR